MDRFIEHFETIMSPNQDVNLRTGLADGPAGPFDLLLGDYVDSMFDFLEEESDNVRIEIANIMPSLSTFPTISKRPVKGLLMNLDRSAKLVKLYK